MLGKSLHQVAEGGQMGEETRTRAAKRQPAVFLPHGGGPCFFMDWTWGPADTWERARGFLESFATSLPERPKALLVISGHWEEAAFTVGTAARPELIFDYSDFPEHTYQLTWPAPGKPELAREVERLLQEAGLPTATNARRGYDHGVFVPLKVAFPQAEIPVVTLSLQYRLDPALHLAAGRALKPLRDRGVLIVGSGMSFHNMRGFLHPETPERSATFDRWLTAAVESPQAEREDALKHWAQAPFARYAHPREEHLLPLMMAAGAAGEDAGRRIFHDAPMMAATSAYRFG
ncbi:MAG TPA: class III extradiol ring-cleavage dioxygenase [Acidobacteriaceae bacterium]|nr:class III extradiol ring-cleavage dioxygenase [Acidobacteriaceae bacterium]